LVQAAFKADAFRQLGREVRLLREKGKLAEDFEGNKYGYQTWVELLSIIDEDTPDAEHILGYQLFQIAKRLTSNELLVLKGVFELYKRGPGSPLMGGGVGYSRWSEIVAEHLGHYLKSLVQAASPSLEKHQLLSEHFTGDTIYPQNGRLTDLGIKFCENVERYQVEKRDCEN
jgi:hypothetical protein